MNTNIGEDRYPDRNEMLSLPKSVNSFLVLKQYVLNHYDAELFNKLIIEYLDEIPLWELVHLCSAAQLMLTRQEYDRLLDFMFVYGKR